VFVLQRIAPHNCGCTATCDAKEEKFMPTCCCVCLLVLVWLPAHSNTGLGAEQLLAHSHLRTFLAIRSYTHMYDIHVLTVTCCAVLHRADVSFLLLLLSAHRAAQLWPHCHH
jgi:hypothetical protein